MPPSRAESVHTGCRTRGLPPFAETLRAAERAGGAGGGSGGAGRRIWGWVPAALLGGAWLLWTWRAPVTLTAESLSARIESAVAPVILRAPVAGRIAAWPLAAGRRVELGALLVMLDAPEPRAHLDALAARRSALLAEVAARAAEEESARRALAEEERGVETAAAERGARARQAATAAALAGQVDRRTARLLAAGLVSAADAARSRSEAEQSREAAAAAGLDGEAALRLGRARVADRRAALGRLAAERAHLAGELAAVAAETAAAARALAQCTLRAPVAGWVAQTAALREGLLVDRGAALATLVPDAAPVVAAVFDPAALSALRPGQRAWVHVGAAALSPPLHLAAVVRAVGVGAGVVEVRFPPAAAALAAALRPGQPCQVEVELARTTPAALAWRALGLEAGGAAAPLARGGARAPAPGGGGQEP